MMNKMKMEDNERKEAHKKIEDERRERNREMGIPEPLIPPEPVPEEEEYQHRGRRGRDQPRFQRGGPPRGRGRGQRGRYIVHRLTFQNIFPPQKSILFLLFSRRRTCWKSG